MGASVVIVDDDDDIAALLTAALRRAQIHALRASNGESGSRLIREEQPQIVLVDWMMPVKDGIQVCEDIRADLALPQPHIIMLTARAHSADHGDAFRAGADMVITKPFRIREIVEHITTHLVHGPEGDASSTRGSAP